MMYAHSHRAMTTLESLDEARQNGSYTLRNLRNFRRLLTMRKQGQTITEYRIDRMEYEVWQFAIRAARFALDAIGR